MCASDCPVSREVFIRHGESTWNEVFNKGSAQRCFGGSNVIKSDENGAPEKPARLRFEAQLDPGRGNSTTT